MPGSRPTIVAPTVRPSGRPTVTSSSRSRTWSAVRIRPPGAQTTPLAPQRRRASTRTMDAPAWATAPARASEKAPSTCPGPAPRPACPFRCAGRAGVVPAGCAVSAVMCCASWLERRRRAGRDDISRRTRGDLAVRAGASGGVPDGSPPSGGPSGRRGQEPARAGRAGGGSGGAWGGGARSGRKGVTERAGRVTVKMLPLPGELSTVIVPPWASAIHFPMARPRPVPPAWRARSAR